MLAWPLTWSLHHFSDSYTGASTTLFLLFEYLTWSAYLYPVYAGVAVVGGSQLLKRDTSAPLIIILSMLPFLSATPYIAVSLALSFTV